MDIHSAIAFEASQKNFESKRNLDRISSFMKLLWNNRIGLRAKKLSELPLFPDLKQDLEALYTVVIEERRHQHPRVIVRTEAQRVFVDKLKQESKHKFEQSVWIGPYCADIFYSSVASALPGTRGLVIELDGGIHNTEGKTKKDDSKSKFLADLNIAVSGVDNSLLKEPWNLKYTEGLSNLRRLSSAQKWKVTQTVQLATVLCQRSETNVFDLLFSKKISEPKESSDI